MNNWEEVVSQAGYRLTEPRRAVMAVLLATDVPVSAQEILTRGRDRHAGLGLVTVYRSLELFEQLGLTCRVHLHAGCHEYVATSPGHRHRIVCRRCGRSVEFQGHNDLDDIIARLESRTGYRVHDHLLELLGLCPECQRAEKS